MAEIVRRRSWGGVLPLGRHVSISGSRSIHAPSVSIAPSSFQEEQNARHHKQFKLEQALIHLMRDINEDVLKHPFNDELTFIATRFGALLREIIETVDRYGLKRRNLGKHKRAAEQFINDVAGLKCATETGVALQKRIEKNKDKLFNFLNHDNVSWNNNNAEHAVKAFTRLRNVMCTSTAKGTSEYCILLSLQQTLRYRGIRFLDFLRSGALEIKD